MAPWTIKARNNSALGDPQDVTDAVIAEQVTPASGHMLLGWDGGQLRKFDVGNLPTGGGGESNDGANVGTGTGLIYRDKTGITLNFKSLRSSDASVTITDEVNTIDLVAAAGSDTNRLTSSKVLFVDNDPGAVNTPEYTTITAAIAAATDGDLVVVMPGIYQEQITIPDGVTVVSYQISQNYAITSNAADNICAIEAPPGSNFTNESLVTMQGTRACLRGFYVLMSTTTTYAGTINSLTGQCSAIGGIGHVIDSYVLANCDTAANVCAVQATGNAIFAHNSQFEAGNPGAGSAHLFCALDASTAFWVIDSLLICGPQLTAAMRADTTVFPCIVYGSKVRNVGATNFADIGAASTVQTQNTHLGGLVVTGAGTFTDLDQVTAGAITAGTDTTPAKWSAADVVSAIAQHESGGGSGDVVGPASAVDNSIAAFDGTTGKLIKDGGVDVTSVGAHLGNAAIHVDWSLASQGTIHPTNYAAAPVDSVFGRTGAVVATATDYDGFNVKESTENTTAGALQAAVVSALPGTPDANTIYFVTG
jgi:hypothetical protein